MKKAILLLSLFFAILLTGCFPKGSVDETGYYEAYDIVRTAVPFSMDGADDQSRARVELIDTDDFGRRMFVYNQYSFMLQKQISIWLICQSTDDEYAYYYSDVCYRILPEDGNLEGGSLETFKKSNDWNENIDESKCAQVRYVYDNENKRDYDESDEELDIALAQHFDLNYKYRFMHDFIEKNTNGQQLLIARVQTDKKFNDGRVDLFQTYLVLYDDDTDLIIAYKTISPDMIDLNNNIFAIGEFIRDFKLSHSF